MTVQDASKFPPEVLLKLYRAALQRDPTHFAATEQLARLLTRSGDCAGTLSVWQALCDAAPENAQAWQRLAAQQVTWNLIPQALGNARRAVDVDPSNAHAWATLGFALRHADEDTAADDAFEKAYALDKRNAHAARGTGQGLLRRRDYAGHLAFCEEAFANVGPVAWLIAQYSVTLAMLGRRTELQALVDYDRLLREVTIDVPDGFTSIDEFNGQLCREIATLEAAPNGSVPSDIVNGGLRMAGGPGRVVDRLGAEKAPASAALIEFIQSQLQRYEAELPDCLLRRARPSGYYFNTEALITQRQSYVAMHTHACTWVALVYYAKVPDRPANAGKAGFMEFAAPKSKADIPDGIWPSKVVEAVPGKLAIFPGYFYHHVHSSVAEGQRIAITMDAHPNPGATKSNTAIDAWLRTERQE